MPGFLDRLAAVFAGVGPPAAPTAAAPPPSALTPDDPRIPDAIRPRVARLLALIAQVEARAARDPLAGAAAVEVRQMRDRHLPQLIGSYHDIPASHRAEIFRETGRSASFQLGAAIDRMASRAEAVARGFAAEDIGDFNDALRFIDQRYGPDDPTP